MAVVPDSALSQTGGGGAAGGSGIDMLSAGPATTSIDAGQLAADVSLTETGLPAELLPASGADGADTELEPEQPRRPTTPGGRRRVDDQAVQKSKQDMQNCFGFDVSG